MGNSFKLLRIFSRVFKVMAWLVLILIGVGLAGVILSKDPDANTPPVLLNMLFSGLVGFVLMYSLGEIIRVLLAIESNTRKP